MPSFSVEGLTEASSRVLAAAGAPDDIADQLARWLANSNLAGHPSHGFQRIPEYVGLILKGEMKPAERPTIVSETATTVLIEGNKGFGHFAAELLTRVVAAKAKESAVAIGGMTNVTHIGRLGEWGELGNELGVISFLCMGWAGGAADIAAPFGGAEPRVGTLPFTFGAPAAEDDGMLIDMATTASAEGKVRVYRDKGLPVPDGWLLDQDGRPTNDPAKLYEGGMLVPFGGHKGYAVGLMVSLLGANLVGSAVEGGENPAGGFALAIDPAAFGDAEVVRRGIRANLERLRDTRPAPGFTEVQVPGDFERASCRALAGQPLDIPDSTWELYLDSAEKVGVSADEVNAIAGGAG